MVLRSSSRHWLDTSLVSKKTTTSKGDRKAASSKKGKSPKELQKEKTDLIEENEGLMSQLDKEKEANRLAKE